VLDVLSGYFSLNCGVGLIVGRISVVAFSKVRFPALPYLSGPARGPSTNMLTCCSLISLIICHQGTLIAFLFGPHHIYVPNCEFEETLILTSYADNCGRCHYRWCMHSIYEPFTYIGAVPSNPPVIL
jgi:hypothetical protein